MTTRNSFDDGEFKLFDQDGNVGGVVNAIPSRLGVKEGTGNLTKALVAIVPTFHIAADFCHGGEGRALRRG
jgi:hypothetical protein